MTIEPQELSIQELLGEGKNKYIIPLYQRNYAWTELEIIQLLQDIYSLVDTNSNYYIGTLIIDIRKDGYFEIIDGQQRHTTLLLINAVLKGKYKKSLLNNNNLNFDARPEVQAYFEKIYTSYEDAKLTIIESSEIQNIKTAINIIESFFSKKESEIDVFVEYFNKKVKIIRISVPDDTDINHYFEIMNTRGEQLEKHEILKAKFISIIENDDLKKKFATIWNACSQMDKPIQLCFDKDIRGIIFGKDYTEITKDVLSKEFIGNEEVFKNSNENLLSTILSSKNITFKINQDSQKNDSEKYKSIIDFPNFLLQVLKLQNNSISLDDKKILDEFGYTNTLPNAITFVNLLFEFRVLFDKYIIKRDEGKNKWTLLKPVKNSDDTVGFRNSLGKDEEDNEDAIENMQFIMLQSMLHVSFPSNNYKNWLHDIFTFFKINSGTFDSDSYYKTISKNSNEYFKNESYEFNNGTHTSRYLFNFLDYVLWKTYKNNNQINGLDLLLEKNSTYKKKFEDFKFTQNNSVEHMFPQHYINELTILENDTDENFLDKHKILNHFGNLCLISRGSNSKYSDYNFEAKKSQFEKERNYIESLKQVIMFSYSHWNSLTIKEHGNEMLEILRKHLEFES